MGSADDSAASRKTLWEAMSPDTRASFIFPSNYTVGQQVELLQDILDEENALVTFLDVYTKDNPWASPSWKVGSQAPILEQDVFASNGEKFHPQLAVHLPGHEPPEQALAAARTAFDWMEDVHTADHVVPSAPKEFWPPEATARRAIFDALVGYLDNPPKHTAWAGKVRVWR